MTENEYGLLTFNSTHAAMAAQRVLKGKVNFQICPVLRMISASCGIALRISMENVEISKKLLEENKIDENMYNSYCIFSEDGCQKFKLI